MLNHWLKGIDFQNDQFAEHQLGNKVSFHQATFPDIAAAKVVLLGIEEAEANAARTALYALANQFSDSTIADLGNVRKREISFLIPVLKELAENGKCVILLGSSPKWVEAQWQAYRQSKGKGEHCLLIDDRVRLELELKATERTIVGGQRHLTTSDSLQQTEQQHWTYHSLGNCRKELSAVEPSIRDTHLASVHVAALKETELPGQIDASPSGFFLEEACQLTYYAGMNDQLNSIGFYGWKARKKDTLSPKAIAQLIWYFIEGVHNRKQDYPISMESMAEYIVHLKTYDLMITFWKSYKSERWWLQLPDRRTHNRLIPCSYTDYQLAGQGTISDRLLRIIRP